MIQVIDLGDGAYGYEVTVNGSKVRQEHAPALNGIFNMSQTQAQQLAALVEAKMINRMAWSVSAEQIWDLWDGRKTVGQIIAEEQGL